METIASAEQEGTVHGRYFVIKGQDCSGTQEVAAARGTPHQTQIRE